MGYRYFRIHGGTPMCGEDFEEYIKVKSNMLDIEEALDSLASEYSQENGMEWFETGLDEEDYESESDYLEDVDQEETEYLAQCYGSWEEVNPEEEDFDEFMYQEVRL